MSAQGKTIIYINVDGKLAGILAVALGLVVALVVDAQDHRIFDRRQAENMLEVPVLGAISIGTSSRGEQ